MSSLVALPIAVGTAGASCLEVSRATRPTALKGQCA